MTRGSGKNGQPPSRVRATRCELLWALLFLVVASALGWWLIAKLIG